MAHDEKVLVPPIKTQGIKTKLVPFIRENVELSPSEVRVEPFMITRLRAARAGCAQPRFPSAAVA